MPYLVAGMSHTGWPDHCVPAHGAGDEPPPLTQSVLDLKLLDPRASLDGDHAPQGMQHLSSEYAGSSMLGGGLAYEEGGSDTGMRADASHLYAK